MQNNSNSAIIYKQGPKFSSSRTKPNSVPQNVVLNQNNFNDDKVINTNKLEKSKKQEIYRKEIIKKLQAANRRQLNLSIESRKSAIKELQQLNRITSSTKSLKETAPNGATNSLHFKNDHTYLGSDDPKIRGMIRASSNMTFSMPFGNKAGHDMGEYLQSISKASKSNPKKVTERPKCIPGVRYICGVPQPVRNDTMAQASVYQNNTKSYIKNKKTQRFDSINAVRLRPISDDNGQMQSTSWLSKNKLGDASKLALESRLKNQKKFLERYDEEVDQDDLDFIDDFGTDLADDDVSWKNELRNITKYDPRKYKNEELNDNNMESNFGEICNEENLSSRIGDFEDKEELKLEINRHQEKKLRKVKSSKKRLTSS